MIAAVYARKSTKQSDVADEEKSVSRQITLAKQLAAEKKWDVIDTYIDNEVSGQEYARLANRARLYADALAGKFQAVIVRDYDRVSRDDREGPAFVYMLADAGVQVWEYLSRAPIKTDRAMDRGMLSMKATFAAAEAEAASDRTREQKFVKARGGTIADGRVLGYRNEGPAKARQRVVDAEQAEIVVRIFTMASEGKGLLRIANELNKAGVVNPTGQSRGDEPKEAAKFWAPSGLRAVLHRRLYLGEVVYGATKNARRGGRRIKVAGTNPVTIERPDLRIISDELWTAAHRVLAKRRATYTRRSDGKLLNKPETGAESQFLLGGFVVCARCGGRMTPVKRSGKRGRQSFGYQCRIRRERGEVACAQRESVPVKNLHDAVVNGLDRVLVPERLDRVLQTLADDHVAKADVFAAQRAGLQVDMSQVEAELKNLTAAIAGGASVESFLAGIKEREARRRDLRARLDAFDAEVQAAGRSVPRDQVMAELRTTCGNWMKLLRREPAQGRRVLRDLRIDRVVVGQDARGRWLYRLEGDISTALGFVPGVDYAVDSRIVTVTRHGEPVDTDPDPELARATWCDDAAVDEVNEPDVEPIASSSPANVPPG